MSNTNTTRVITQVPRDLYERLLIEQHIDAKTDFSNAERAYAYKFLAKCANYDNFFFGMAATTAAQLEVGLYHAQTFSLAKDKALLYLDIPTELLYACALYDFGELIYVTGIEDDPDIAKWCETRIANQTITKGADNNAIQYIYPCLRLEWLDHVVFEQFDPYRGA